jgi:hypothetical protein
MDQKTVDHFAAKTRTKIKINNLADWVLFAFFPRRGRGRGRFSLGLAGGRSQYTQERHRMGEGGCLVQWWPWVLKLVEEITCAYLGVH